MTVYVNQKTAKWVLENTKYTLEELGFTIYDSCYLQSDTGYVEDAYSVPIIPDNCIVNASNGEVTWL